MRNNKLASTSHNAESESAIFACRYKDSSPLFGTLLMGALKEQLGTGPGLPSCSGRMMDKITEYFPQHVLQKNPACSPLGIYTSKDPQPYLQVQLIACDNYPGPLNEKYFRHFGYVIDPAQQQFNVLRGSLVEHVTEYLYEQFTSQEKIYSEQSALLDNLILFPYRIDKTYGFDALPSTMKFLNDMCSFGQHHE